MSDLYEEEEDDLPPKLVELAARPRRFTRVRVDPRVPCEICSCSGPHSRRGFAVEKE